MMHSEHKIWDVHTKQLQDILRSFYLDFPYEQ